MTTDHDRIARLARAVADTKPEARLLPAGSEQRFCHASIRSEQTDGKRYAVGHAATFGTLSRDLGGFRERIQRGAFSRAIDARQDCKFLLNHSADHLIARVANNSLRLREDSVGLAFRAEIPNTTAGDDLAEMLAQGLLTECSFAFTIGPDGQRWSRETDVETGENIDVRDLLEVDELYDCSAVTYPAYPNTNVQASRALWAGGKMPLELRSHIGAVHISDSITDDQKNLVRRARLALASIL